MVSGLAYRERLKILLADFDDETPLYLLMITL